MYLTKTRYILMFVAFTTALIILFSLKRRNEQVYLTLIPIDNFNGVQQLNRTSEKLFDVDFYYVLNNDQMCEKFLNISALFIVTSYFGNVETRSAMRRAFSREDLKQLNFRRVFLLGQTPTDKYTTQKAVDDEGKRFGDIIQGNFIEAYKNLTYKHIMGLKWAAENCYNAQFIVKMDDDIVVNIDRIPALLSTLKFPKSGNFLAGYILRNMIPIREPVNKWFVTMEEYNENIYPPFVSGWFYITTPNTCARFVSLSQTTKYFWIDDTYVTGILAKKLNIKHFDISQYFAVHSEFLDCCIQDIRNRHLDCDILVGPNGGDNNLFYEFNNVINICNLKLCKERTRPLNETCIAERKVNLGRGNAVVESYQLH